MRDFARLGNTTLVAEKPPFHLGLSVRMSVLNLSGVRKMPLLRQAEAAECGLACVGMIAGAHGHKMDLPTLRSKFPISLKGATLKDIIEISAQMDMGARAVRCEPEELKGLRVPAILHWNMNHFVVFSGVSGNKFTIYDPAAGKVTMTLEEASKHFTGVALELTPSSGFQRKRERNPVKLISLVKLDGTAWKAVVQGLALSVFLQVFVLLAPYYMQLVIDEAILKGDFSLLMAIATGFALLKLFEAITTIIRGLVFQFLSNILAFDMEASLFHHMARLPLTYFHRRHVGDIQQRFQSLGPIRDFIANGAIAALIDGFLAIFLGIIIFLYNAMLGFVVVGFVVVYAALRFAFLSLSKRLSGDFLVADAKENTKFLETLRAMQTVKVSGIENEREGLWRNLAADTLNAQIRMGNVNIGYGAISQTLMGLSNILVIYLAASSAIGGAMTIGMITAFVAYKGQFEQKLMALLETYVNFKLLDVHLERVSDIALAKKEDGLQKPSTGKQLDGRITIQNLHFRYAQFEPDILKGANLEIEPGDFIALAAPSGEGKSTLLRLILGLYQPSHGKIFYDGLEGSKWGLSSLRQQMGVVMQDDTLLAGSIEENICLFDERPDRDRILEVARIAAIHEDIEAMPMGYRSLVGDMGTTLSGGQQQRVMLARALYREPRLLVMDEGTSALDVQTERRINEELKKLSITRIIAAHRPETLAAADKVIALHQGRLQQIEFKPRPVGLADETKTASIESETKGNPNVACLI
ncbi:MAG TPA: ABC transporter [Hyphomonas sp.]|jgi:ATP-binding cassette subfamily B protein RaxB|uniref:peptidase domain-containing ABC transporter n=3 Tax=Hyphomonas TaxID=85 RepID=UPI000C918B38|nr:peptidase domain-containing ABC transporter [Hyphomonas sp.]MAL46482.1 ABC transporter [Hyphomonas sp.]HAW53758.1 ABC transporter [Hyphomonas sp.]HBJ40208.1 ABC transporter [Hyphomonas sp.]HBN93098.1 ABC transporter [Hyphomonas sp.]HBT36723.1 ABC transporter [Hyphomonas sp.]|tara:strand:+ start:5928 stop:8192 length:2265 start_codon:yes stop_codon:yes gene_type:complete